MTRGEASNEYIQIGRVRLTLVLHLVVHLDPVFMDRTDPMNVIRTTAQEFPEFHRVYKFFDLSFVGLLAKFAPHGVQHLFGEESSTGIFLDVLMFQQDTFPLGPSVDVFMLKVGRVAMGGVPAGLFFQLEPGIDVVPKEPHPGLFEVVHLVNVQELVTFLQGFLQFWHAPRAGQCSFRVPMMGVIHRFLMHGGVDVVVHAGRTQGNVNFPLHRYGKTGWSRSVGGRMVHDTRPKYFFATTSSTDGLEMFSGCPIG